ncbi:uncharacterized protein LOC125067927 [Vanessa atalanta]|uniref:uncharacterized protein LOC125067927 n=1 Tax=Vanessa atalanta TaxID=42275 RepID=UPI001FCE252B|nr:uncharacterized protein LOC125067927 [Vanessa atalanta]
MDSEMETASEASVEKHRPLESDDSDSGNEGVKSARPAAHRRGEVKGNGLARARAELKEKEEEEREVAFERALRSRAFKKAPTEKKDAVVPSSSVTKSMADPATLGAEELHAEAERNVAAILTVAKKSGNLKFGYIKSLKESAAALQAIVKVLSSRTEAEETRRLQADNSRLRREVENLKEDLKAHRREFADMRATMTASSGPSLATPSTDAMIDELREFITISIGAMLDARLPPPRVSSPPATTVELDVPRPSMPPTASAPKKQKQSKNNRTTPAATVPPAARTPIPSAQAGTGQEESWATVVRKGKKDKKPSPPVANKLTTTQAVTLKKGKISMPRTAAVIISLQPEAEEKGVTYAQVLEKAEQSVDLVQLGIGEGIKIRRAATGARVLELPKSQSQKQAGRLADKLRVALDGVANVVLPVRMTELRITGLDDSVTKTKLAAAIARVGNCPVDSVRVGTVGTGPAGVGMATVRCPTVAAKTLANSGRFLVGWSSARVRVLEQQPLRCFRCFGLGHTRALCPSKVDRSSLCYRCGGAGHLAPSCSAPAHCAVCAEAGRLSGHSMGGRDCNPPHTKGKAVQGTRAAPIECSRQASEEAQRTKKCTDN